MSETATCCPPFDPQPWEENTFTWENKQFVKDRVRSLFHIPLNIKTVMSRNIKAIEAADAAPGQMLVLFDENSLWGADVYFEITKDIPDANTATISGSFVCKVFEGPFKYISNWIKEMKSYVEGQGKRTEKLYFYYTTCPKCAKEYGKNYVVLLSRVASA